MLWGLTVSSPLPKHIAIAMDGNGRWAKNQNKPRGEGHRQGIRTAEEIYTACLDRGIPYLTLWAFSTENWRRPVSEVRLLMRLVEKVLTEKLDEIKEKDIRLRIIGNRHRLSPSLLPHIDKAVHETRHGKALNLTIALDYGGRDDIVQGVKKIYQAIQSNTLSIDDVTEDYLSSCLMTHDLPDPDLFIRPGGVRRVSNYLIWQFSYTEMYFTETLWPDFSQRDLDQALAFYGTVQRRFGGI